MRRYQMRTDQEYRFQLVSALVERGLSSDSSLALALATPSHGTAVSTPRIAVIPPEDALRLVRPDEVRLLDTTVTPPADDEASWRNELQLVTVSIDRLNAPQPREGASVERPSPFVRAETFRTREIVLAAAATDDPRNARVLHACAERMQIVSKLDRLIRSSPADGTLRKAAESAMYDEETLLTFITKLFGPGPAARWDPADPADMAVDLPEIISADPLAVLQDGDGRFTADEQKLALYAFLVQRPLAPGEEAWVRSIAESWLAEE